MHNVAELIISWIVTTGLTFAVILMDEGWMSEERLQRAWPPSSRDAAIIAFGPLAIILHFLRTRGGFRTMRRLFLGNALGYALSAGALVVVSLVGSVFINLVMMLLGQPADWSVESPGPILPLILMFMLAGVVVILVFAIITITLNAILMLLGAEVDWTLE